MKKLLAGLGMIVLVGCSTTRNATGPFSEVFLRVDVQTATGTNLYLVVDTRPPGGSPALNQLVAQHAADALKEAKHHQGRFDEIIFFVRDRPDSESGCAASLTVGELQQIADDPDDAKRVLFSQSWPVLTLPVERETPEQRPSTEPPQ